MLKIEGDDNVCVPHDAYARVDILNRHRQTNYYSLSHCARGTIEHIDCTHTFSPTAIPVGKSKPIKIGFITPRVQLLYDIKARLSPINSAHSLGWIE